MRGCGRWRVVLATRRGVTVWRRHWKVGLFETSSRVRSVVTCRELSGRCSSEGLAGPGSISPAEPGSVGNSCGGIKRRVHASRTRSCQRRSWRKIVILEISRGSKRVAQPSVFRSGRRRGEGSVYGGRSCCCFPCVGAVHVRIRSTSRPTLVYVGKSVLISRRGSLWRLVSLWRHGRSSPEFLLALEDIAIHFVREVSVPKYFLGRFGKQYGRT